MTSQTSHFEAARGMRDFYPQDMQVRNAIFAAWTQAARLFGFAQYDACLVESLDLFKRKSGPEIVAQIYAFQDKSGRDLALRPEMTPSLARLIAARQGALVFPLKWFAIAQCFRYERMSRGRKREHYQWNLDILGETALSAEAEALACALSALELLGLNGADVQVYYSNRALLAELLLRSGIPAVYHPATFRALDKRAKISDADIAALLQATGLTQTHIDAVFNILAIRSLAAAAEYLGETSPALQALISLQTILGDYGFADRLQFDLGVIRGLDYYTGIVFEAFDAQKKFRALFGGGRYDRLLADLGGASLPAVGLGFGDVVISELLAEKGKLAAIAAATRLDMAIGFMEAAQRAVAVKIAQALRRAGQSVEVALHPEKPKYFFGRASKNATQRAIYLGPDDLTRGTVRVKDLAKRIEREVTLAELLSS